MLRHLTSLFSLGSLALGLQIPLSAGNLSPESSPAAISGDVHTAIHDPEISSDHSVRIKKTEHFCNDTATLYTGYLDAPSRHLFFWFAESRRDPHSDDLMLWTNGKSQWNRSAQAIAWLIYFLQVVLEPRTPNEANH